MSAAEDFSKLRYTRRIFDTCEDLYGSISGTGDSLSVEDFTAKLSWLKLRLEHWEPSLVTEFEPYDNAVKHLASIVLELAGKKFP